MHEKASGSETSEVHEAVHEGPILHKMSRAHLLQSRHDYKDIRTRTKHAPGPRSPDVYQIVQPLLAALCKHKNIEGYPCTMT